MAESLISLITPEEFEMIEDRRGWAGNCNRSSYCSPQALLCIWEKEKKRWLADLFGDKLILKKEVTLEEPDDIIRDAMWDHFFKTEWGCPANDGTWTRFRIVEAVESLYIHKCINNNCYRALTKALNDKDMFVENRFTNPLELPEKSFSIKWDNGSKKANISFGMKLMKVLGKVVHAYGGIKTFDAFVVEHSQVLNSRKVTGNLCISIHPLDYMTMSDNNCNWHSCMSWENDGEYKQGTVEMMNSSAIVVGYIESATPMSIGHHSWNSKKWRSLYFVNDSLITNIKGYPYKNHPADKAILAWLKELMEKTYGNTYGKLEKFCSEENTREISLSTNIMYNDCEFGNVCTDDEFHIGFVNTKVKPNELLYFDYSGPCQCMICGAPYSIDDDCPEELACSACSEYVYCDECGGAYEREEMVDVEGCWYCEDCANTYLAEDCVDDILHHMENMVRIQIVRRLNDETFYYDSGYNERFFTPDNAYTFMTSILPELVKKETLDKYLKEYPYEHLYGDDTIFITNKDLTEKGKKFFNYLEF